jgi:transposase InsO family protein
MTARQRERVRQDLAGPLRRDRHAPAAFARAFGTSVRHMRALRAEGVRAYVPGPVGRPRTPDAERARVRELVHGQRTLQGKEAGWRPIHEALAHLEPPVSRTLVQAELSALKCAARGRQRRVLEAQRQSHEILARDAVWGEDTTHLGRQEEDGAKVEAEVIKDLGTLETVGLSVGAVPTAQDVRALLAQTAAERGGFPLVWMGDQGSINRDATLQEKLEEEQVVHLLSRVHTPTDNAATEHQHRELKGESSLGKGVRLADTADARDRLEEARRTLDGGRLRATKGWRTARELAAHLPRADGLVDRARFYAAACAAMEDATRGLDKKRDVLKARRDAVFASLVAFGLATPHVGWRPRERPGPPPCNAGSGRLECAGAPARRP